MHEPSGQIEVHPYVYDKAKPIIEWCHNKGIVIACYTTLASIIHFPGGPLDAVVKKIANELDATEDQVLMKWAHQVTYGGIIVTTSCKKERLVGQIRAFGDMEDLSHEKVQAITDAGEGMHQRVYVRSIFGLTHQALLIDFAHSFRRNTTWMMNSSASVGRRRDSRRGASMRLREYWSSLSSIVFVHPFNFVQGHTKAQTRRRIRSDGSINISSSHRMFRLTPGWTRLDSAK